jgi:hypothetical protein
LGYHEDEESSRRSVVGRAVFLRRSEPMKTLRAALVVSCLFLPACYDFDFPLDEKPQVPVDTRLLGSWHCLGVESDLDEGAGVLRITRRTDTIFRWTLEAPSAHGTRDHSVYDVHGSSMPGGSFLNTLEVGEKANGKWNFVKYSFLLPHVLSIQIVDDKPFEKAKASAALLRKEVEKRRNDPTIYSDLLVCVRAKPSASPEPTPKP